MVSGAPKKPTPPTRISAKTAPSSSPDNRLFIRLNSKHQWRKISPAGIREAVAQLTNAPQAAIEHVYRVPTGFALRAINKESRQLLLNAAESFHSIGGRLEEASDLVALQIPTVPVAIHTLLGRVQVTEGMVIEEITKFSKAVPVKVRPPVKLALTRHTSHGSPNSRRKRHEDKGSGYSTTRTSRSHINRDRLCSNTNAVCSSTERAVALAPELIGTVPPRCTRQTSAVRTPSAATAEDRTGPTVESAWRAPPNPGR